MPANEQYPDESDEEFEARQLLTSDTPEGKAARYQAKVLKAATTGRTGAPNRGRPVREYGRVTYPDAPDKRNPARKAIDDFEGQRAVNQMNNPELYGAPQNTSPADTSDPNEKLDQMGDLFGGSDVATELQGRNYSTEGETPDTGIIAPPSFGNSGINIAGVTPEPSNLFGLDGGASGVQGAGGLSGGGVSLGGKPSQTALEFGSGQRAPAGGKPDTKKPEEAPYQRKRADEIGIVANREDRVRGRQKFAAEIGGAGGYDKLSGEQKDRGLELGLQERDIQKFYNKKDDKRRS